jgi:hypothetical protein
MRSDGLLKHLALCLLIAVVFYVAAFGWIEHRRTVKGPWEVTFRTDAAGTPALFILQTHLNVSETLVFTGCAIQPANLARTIGFARPPAALPFGELVFQDPTFLPGTVTLRLFGHQIELLPRVLAIDKKEYPWRAGSQIEVRWEGDIPRS